LVLPVTWKEGAGSLVERVYTAVNLLGSTILRTRITGVEFKFVGMIGDDYRVCMERSEVPADDRGHVSDIFLLVNGCLLACGDHAFCGCAGMCRTTFHTATIRRVLLFCFGDQDHACVVLGRYSLTQPHGDATLFVMMLMPNLLSQGSDFPTGWDPFMGVARG